jgi:hypothetical protein
MATARRPSATKAPTSGLAGVVPQLDDRQARELQAQVAADILKWGVPRLVGVGYGLLSRKAAHPRWPEFFITALVLRKYRGKSSYWFMIRHALRGMRKHEIIAGEAKAILARLIGSKPYQLHQLAGIYRALREEKGAAVATAGVVEIIRITNQRRIQRKGGTSAKFPRTPFKSAGQKTLPKHTQKKQLRS